jgi:hypothetical protein
MRHVLANLAKTLCFSNAPSCFGPPISCISALVRAQKAQPTEASVGATSPDAAPSGVSRCWITARPER